MYNFRRFSFSGVLSFLAKTKIGENYTSFFFCLKQVSFESCQHGHRPTHQNKRRKNINRYKKEPNLYFVITFVLFHNGNKIDV